MLGNYYHEFNTHLQYGLGAGYSIQSAVNRSEVSAPVARK